MEKKKEASQGYIVDKIHKIRATLWDKYKGDMNLMAEEGKKIALNYGMHIKHPPHRLMKSALRKSRKH